MSLVFNLLVLLSLVPASLQALRRPPSRDVIFWLCLVLAAGGAAIRVAAQLKEPWQTGFAATLWVTIAAILLLYLVIAAVAEQAWRLAPLAALYVLLLGAIATVWQHEPGRSLLAGSDLRSWVAIHIAVSVLTYGLVTLAAVAALAAFFQERALKRRRATALSRMLPPVADCESLVVKLLTIGEGVLAVGLATGSALAYGETGHVLLFDHKTVLTIAAFLVIGALLFAHYGSGVRGRRAARIVLLAYLLLTLGYPGVKFVTDVLMT